MIQNQNYDNLHTIAIEKIYSSLQNEREIPKNACSKVTRHLNSNPKDLCRNYYGYFNF